MRNKLISIIAICMSFSLLTGCGSGQAKGSGNEEPAVNTAESAQEVTEDAEQDTPEVTQQAEDDVPEDVSLFGGWIHVGKNYITDLWKVDFNQLLSSYQGHMLLLHGDKDSTVPLSYSEEAKEIIPDCEFYVIKDGGHEFFGQPFEDAMGYILPYLEGQLNH